MCELADLFHGQTVEWYDLGFTGCVTGIVEYISAGTGWVTVRLNDPYTLRAATDGSAALQARHVTHTTIQAAWLTPRD